MIRSAFESRLAQLCLRGGGPGLPRAQVDRAVLFKSVLLSMGDAAAAQHTERAINDLLKAWLAEVGRNVDTDHVALRRTLVDDGWLVRSADGGVYRAADGKGAAELDASIEEVDPREAIRRAEETAARRKRERSSAPDRAP